MTSKLEHRTLNEYCKLHGLDLTGLSVDSLEALGSSYLEGLYPAQKNIDNCRRIDSGEITSDELVQELINHYKKS